MKNVVFQYFLNFNGVGKQGAYYTTEGIPDWAVYSSNYFKKYAETHNADYYFFTDRFVNATSNFFEVLRLYKDTIFDQYDKVLYVDVDVMPKKMTQNIFDVDVEDVAGWPEWRHPDVSVAVNWTATTPIVNRFKHFNAQVTVPYSIPSNIRMINSGVMLWSKNARLKAREQFIDHEMWFNYKNSYLDPQWTNAGHSSHCLDQPFLNAMFNKCNFNVVELPIEWNRFPTHNENRSCYFAHYVGDHRYQIPKLYKDL